VQCKGWFLEAVAADGSHVRHEVDRFPFHIGRDVGNELAIAALGLSRRHAELTAAPTGALLLTDLGSTNGTFVNHQRLQGPGLLAVNDVIHFGNAEFRLGHRDASDASQTLPPEGERTMIVPAGQRRSGHFVPQERQFMEFLSGKGLDAAAQPIVESAGGRVFAWELLGRGSHPDLPASPMRLFDLAAQLDREAELSEAFREHGVRALTPRLAGGTLFVNTHPKETFQEHFLQALGSLSRTPQSPRLVVEVHETAVMEVDRMRELAARLREMGVRFAYDDFGAGQARLNELGEVPAHFVKFDMGLIRGIHEASERKQRVVGDLVRLVLDLGSVALAEGVELDAEAQICRQMGFQLIQGYLTGRPMPVSAVHA
jgi:EAL domain-containing protein (putative c-di-GMP-specific phosphodiesterase class I)